jgi:hypothetical protein
MDSLALNSIERESGCYAGAYVHTFSTCHSFYRVASQATLHIVHGLGCLGLWITCHVYIDFNYTSLQFKCVQCSDMRLDLAAIEYVVIKYIFL